jgi:DHA2 family multidrug resistance protein
MAGNSDSGGQGPVSRGGIAAQPLFAVGAVLLGSFLANFDSRLTTVGLPDLRGAFSLGFDEGAWLSTASIGSQIFIAPAVAWLATAFGLRRVLGIPSLVYALVSLVIPFVRDFPTLIALGVVHGMLLGTFVPATLMIILRNLPIRWWLPAIAIYAIRVGFAFDTSPAVVGFYVDHLGWQWLYWQGALIAPLMGLMVYLGTPHEPVNREVLADADWGGMLLLGSGVSMIYAGLDQGNRNRRGAADRRRAFVRGLRRQRVHRSPAMGPRQRAVLAQYRTRAGRTPALRAHQPVQFIAGAEFPCGGR